MQKKWQVQPRTEDSVIAQLLKNRGLADQDEQDNFLNPEYGKLHSPFLFKDMEKAVQRIWQAIDAGEKILIYSDYDADAVTANAVVYRGLKFLGATAEVYIPDRFSEGYGLNLQAFETVKATGARVVITVDCGTNSVAEAEFCKANGIDLIITDHHEITGDVPDAYALINPKNPSETYPYHELVGVGVAFKLVCGIYSKRDRYSLPEGFEKWLLDLVAIGTVADCHSLIGENRILVGFGLKVLAKTKWVGLKKLLERSGLVEHGKPKHVLDTYSIGFVIAPRINAAGRIDHASIAFDLLVTDDEVEAEKLAEELESLNSRRQLLTENVMTEAREQLSVVADRKILMAVGNDWPQGVVGVVAGKLTEEFGKPVLVLERGAEESTGSARSVKTFNIVDALKSSSDILVKYGGHAAAAGFTVRNEHLDIFQKNLLDYAEERLSEEDLVKTLDVEMELYPYEVTLDTALTLDQFEPFGVDNYRPKFLLKNAVIKDMRAVGKTQQHLQFSIGISAPEGMMQVVRCIGFNFGKSISSFRVGDEMDIVCELLAEEWNGRRSLKLRVVDLRKA